MPKEKKAIDCKWMYKKKESSLKAHKVKYKARLIAKEFFQKKGIDFNEILVFVIKMNSMHILFSMVTLFDLKLE